MTSVGDARVLKKQKRGPCKDDGVTPTEVCVCAHICGNISSDQLPSYIKAVKMVPERVKLAC